MSLPLNLFELRMEAVGQLLHGGAISRLVLKMPREILIMKLNNIAE